MAYNPASDSSCQAWWRCEDGALGTDSSGKGNTLTETGVASDLDCQEGSASCDFSGTNDEMSRTDANLTANFPFKSGTTNKTVTVCFWFIADALPSNGNYRGLWGKYITGTGKRSINIGLKGKSTTQVIVFTLAPDPAAAGVEKEHGSDLATGVWYHVAVTYANADRSYRIRIWDDTAGAILGSDATGTFAEDPAVTDALLEIANYNTGGLGLDGRMDDIVVFNRALSVTEIDRVRAQNYPVAFSESVNDGIGLTDSVTRTCQITRTLTESLGATDTIGSAAAMVRTLAESLGITDATAKGEGKTLSDAMGIVDALLNVWAASRSFAEALGATDSLTQDQAKTISDSLAMTDSPVNVSVILRTIADTLGIVDEPASVWEAVRTIADAIGITDAMSAVEGTGENFIETINDALGLSDAMVSLQVILRVMADSLGMADAVASVFVASRVVSDSLQMTDGLVLGRMIAIADTLGVADDLNRVVQYLRGESDAVGLLDAMARIVAAVRTVDDPVGMTDQMSSQFGALFKTVWAFLLLQHRK